MQRSLELKIKVPLSSSTIGYVSSGRFSSLRTYCHRHEFEQSPRFACRLDIKLLRRQRPEYDMHIAPCTNTSVSIKELLVISLISPSVNSLARTVRFMPCCCQNSTDFA